MNAFHNIEQKLEQFIKRYYLSALLKGVLLFFGIGLLYALILLSIEHFFWLGTSGRLFLFFCVFGFEAVLFYGLIFNKPILIITSNEIKENSPIRYKQQNKLAKYLKCKIINIDNPQEYFKIIKVAPTAKKIKVKFLKFLEN